MKRSRSAVRRDAWFLHGLPSLFEFHRCGDGLAVSQDFHFDHIAHFAAAQRIGEVVQIMNRHGSKLDQHVAGLESCLGRRRSRLHVGEFHAVGLLSKIRDGAEARPVTAAATAGGRWAAGLVVLDGYKGDTLRGGIDFHGNVLDKIQQLRGIGRVDFVPGVGGLVVVRVQSREKEKHGNFFRDKGGVIARRVAAGGIFDLEGRLGFLLVEQGS